MGILQRASCLFSNESSALLAKICEAQQRLNAWSNATGGARTDVCAPRARHDSPTAAMHVCACMSVGMSSASTHHRPPIARSPTPRAEPDHRPARQRYSSAHHRAWQAAAKVSGAMGSGAARHPAPASGQANSIDEILVLVSWKYARSVPTARAACRQGGCSRQQQDCQGCDHNL